jgi:DNA-binding transcriptional ArsR family regulator
MSRPINDDVFRAVAHPVRRRILELLRERDRTAGEISAAFRMAAPSISAHLRVLRMVRLISERRVGRGRKYQIHSRGLRVVLLWVAPFQP